MVSGREMSELRRSQLGMNQLRVKDTGNKGLDCIGNDALALSMVAVIYITEPWPWLSRRHECTVKSDFCEHVAGHQDQRHGGHKSQPEARVGEGRAGQDRLILSHYFIYESKLSRIPTTHVLCLWLQKQSEPTFSLHY